MGALSDKARQNSPYIKLNIGETTMPLKYKSWKTISDYYGRPSFRYTFEVKTEQGFVQKTFDNGSQAFADQMDIIPFNAVVKISRIQKVDKDSNPIPDKSIYKVALAEKVVHLANMDEVGQKVEEINEEEQPSEGSRDKPAWAKEILGEEGSSGEEGES